MGRLTRRDFVKAGAVGAASGVFAPFTVGGTKSSARVLGANERIRHAVCGIHGQGRNHLRSFARMKDVEVAFLVDPDSRLFESRSKDVGDIAGNTPVCVQDVREILERKDLDTLSVATCNHWHSLIGVWACQAEKDVYVEKPISHNVFEGRQLARAAEQYDRVVQHGTQQRTSQSRADEISAVHSGRYGRLLVSKGYCCKPRWSIGFKPTGNPPQGLDFNVWLGPAPEQPYHGNLVHYNWHWFWDTGNGDTGNQGVHEIDVARWAIKGATLPSRVWSVGGRFGYEDQGQTPNTQITVMEYPEQDAILLFETRGLVDNEKAPGFPRIVRNEYYTTEGVIRDGRFYPKDGGPAEAVKGDGSIRVAPGGQFGSFIRAVRSRKPQDNNADAETGHYSAALCHLGNISYRLGEPVPFSKKARALGENKQVVESLEVMRENLKAVGVKLAESTYRLGRVLQFDPKAEKFVGDEEANALLTRNYRRPFVVPESV